MQMVSTDGGHRTDTAREPTPPDLLHAVDRLQSRHLAAADAQDLFDTLLGDLLELTRSGDGVLVELGPLTRGQLAPRQRVYQTRREAGDTVHDSHPQPESRGYETLLSAALSAGQ